MARTQVRQNRELLANLTLRELRGRYKRSVLGWTWSLLNPLALTVMFWIVFRLFLRIEPPLGDPSGLRIYALFLLTGLLPWSFLSNGVTSAMGALIGNAGLIKKVYFPRAVLPASAVGAAGATLLIELTVLAAAFMFAGHIVLVWLLPVLVLVGVQMLFVLGLGLLLSVLNAYFRDIEHLMGIVLQLWFYASPIVYPMSLVPERADLMGRSVPVRSIYELNPMVSFLESYRAMLYHGRWPSLQMLLSIGAWTTLALLLGWTTFRRREGRLAEEL